MSRLLKNPTQTEVAALAQVSREAVSQILGGKRANLFNEETRMRVEQAAQQLGYYPHRGAQAMRRGRSNLIVFLHMAGQSELVAKQAYHIGRLVHENGYDYQTVDAFWWVGKGQKVVERIISLKPEGVAVAGALQTDIDFNAILKAGIPVVALNTEVPHAFEIRHDARSSIKQLTLASLSAGKTCPMLLLHDEVVENWLWQAWDRKNGFLDALKEAGMKAPQEVVLQNVQTMQPLKGAAIGYINLRAHAYFSIYEPGRIAAEHIGEAADAIIASNDNLAIGLLTYYLRNDIAIPDQIAISGFDNISAAIQGRVFLTTVEHPTEAMCEAAMNVLVEQIRKKQQKAGQLTLPCEIIWRESMPQPETTLSTSLVLK